MAKYSNQLHKSHMHNTLHDKLKIQCIQGALITDDAKCTRDIPAKPGNNHLEIGNFEIYEESVAKS